VSRSNTNASRLAAVRPAALAVAALAASALAAGCRGTPSEDAPFHLAPDMDWQPHRRPQQAAPLANDQPIFADKRAARPIVEGTVAVGALKADDAFWRGLGEDGKPVGRMPVDAVLAAHDVKSLAQLLPRGQERFNIYCAPCHDMAGTGNGIVIQRSQGGFPPPPQLGSSTVQDMTDGHIFDVITHGVRNMPSYAAQIPEADRWAITLWVRVLSKSQGATIEDVPAAERAKVAEPEAQQQGPGQESGK
jgi:mono/diheme cytochrome c family protein